MADEQMGVVSADMADTTTVYAADLLSGTGTPGGTGPFQLALRRLRRNYVALFFGAVFLLIVILCLLAPVYSKDIAHVGPNTNNISEVIKVNGKNVNVVGLTGIPTG